MHFIMILLGLLLIAPWSNLDAQEVYKNSRYTVRKVKDTCKLEILLNKSDRDPAAILALFPNDLYYGELFTEKKRIGMARDKLRIRFDRGEEQAFGFVANASAKDDYWRWQYLENTQGLLSKISRGKEMTLSFSNGKQEFKYIVSLKGSSNAVLSLRRCR